MKKKTEKPFKKMCPSCGTVFVGYGYSRCPSCQRKHTSELVAKSREEKRKILMLKNDELAKNGLRVCSECYHVRHLSEFRTSQPNRKGKINSICDRCLTKIYETPYRKEAGFCGNYWRRKAYTVNTVGRAKIAKEKGLKTKDVHISELEWECKPQDLADLFEQQDGKCKYCGVQLTKDMVQIDHMTPLSRGGSNSLENLVITCKDCNYLKGTRTSEEFTVFSKEYAKRVLMADGQDKEPGR